MVKFDIKTGCIENTEEELIVLERVYANAPTSRKFVASPDGDGLISEPFFNPEGNIHFDEDMKFMEKYHEELTNAIAAANREEMALKKKRSVFKRVSNGKKK